MSDQYDLRPWYSLLPLPGLILGLPFAFIAFCGNQWQPEQSTFATLARYKQPPQLHVERDGLRTRLSATSWLAWPELTFAHCDVQPVKQPRYAICFGTQPGETTLVRANVEQIELIGLHERTREPGHWLSDGHRYLWGDKLIETKPQLTILPMPPPFADLGLPANEQPRLISLSTDEEYALWEDRRSHPAQSVGLVVTRVADGRHESTLQLDDPQVVATLRDPSKAPKLVQQIIWWTDQGRRQRVLLRSEWPPAAPSETDSATEE